MDIEKVNSVHATIPEELNSRGLVILAVAVCEDHQIGGLLIGIESHPVVVIVFNSKTIFLNLVREVCLTGLGLFSDRTESLISLFLLLARCVDNSNLPNEAERLSETLKPCECVKKESVKVSIEADLGIKTSSSQVC